MRLCHLLFVFLSFTLSLVPPALFLRPPFPFFLSFFPFLSFPLTSRPPPSEPSSPPRGVECSPLGSSSLRVSWRAPPEEGRNVDLEGYEILYQPLASGLQPEPEPERTQRVGPDPWQALLSGLKRWTRYRVSVAAFTSEGSGPQSSALECQTDEDGTIKP